MLAGIVANVIDATVLGHPILGAIVSLGTFIPTLAVATRRLHDTDRSGWWQLIVFVPLIGFIVLIIWLATAGSGASNRFGGAP